MKWQGAVDAFGQMVSTASAINSPLRFAGQYQDNETGYYQNYFRDYNFSTGRYLQSDPIGLAGGLNRFAYVNGRPTRYIDPYGLVEWTGTIEGLSVTAPFGFSSFSIKLRSECINGQRAIANIQTLGPAIGLGSAASIGGSEITVNDSHDYLNPYTFNGWFAYNTVGISIGPGYGAYSIQIGGNGMSNSPTGASGYGHGMGGGYGYGVTGNPGGAALTSYKFEKCDDSCE